MGKKKIALLVTNNLEKDQRVNKVSYSLMNFGFDVTTIGSKSRPCKEYVTPYTNKRLYVFFKHGFLFYLEINIRFFLFLLFSDFDVYVANDTDSLIAAFFAGKIKNKPIVVDLHELFPEVPEVVNRRFVKFVWTKIEDFILPKISNGYTVCKSIADYYAKRYGISLKVVRNVPHFSAYKGKKDEFKDLTGKKIILYQGAVNVGRGIEWIMEAMKYIDDSVFVVVGNGDLYDELKARSNQNEFQGKVLFMGPVPYSNLQNYTLSADLGVCLLDNVGLSYYYSLPNRIFDFMQCHVPILATDFPEISNVVNTYSTGKTISYHDSERLALVIKGMLKESVDHEKFDFAANSINWEKEENILHEIYDQFL